MRFRQALAPAIASALLLIAPAARAADPPVPSSAHPRLFLTAQTLAALTANAGSAGTATAALVASCQQDIDHPEYLTARGNADSDTWPAAAIDCALGYITTQNPQFLATAILYWHASLDDDQNLGDGLGCVQGVDTNWQADWDGSYPPPPVLVTITHDTGYPMRWYGPYLSLTYDWLYGAPGVDDALLSQTRTCLTAWMDYYSQEGYLHDVPGANYNAGYVIGKALAAIAIGNDGGADGHLWTQVLDQDFGNVLIGTGQSWTPAGSSMNVIGGLVGGNTTSLGTPYGAMVGGDWGSWQYGPLSVAEYSAATLALEQNGASLAPMDDWVNSLVVRTAYGTLPNLAAQYGATGDLDSTDPYQTPTANQLDAVLLGPSSDDAASWALFMKQQQQVSDDFIWNALAETRAVTAADFRAQTPPPPLWYVAHGSRTLYARTSWQEDALWAVFESPPAILDHQHFSASSFVLSRGADDLIVNPAPYGGTTSWESNAITADSAVVIGDYAPSQTPWSEADLVWARGTADGVYAARADLANAFIFAGTPSDIAYAHREWVMLPEGEVVTVDRIHTSAPSRNMYVSFHTNTGGGGLTLSGGVAAGTVGSSAVAIHAILPAGVTPQITQPSTGDCTVSCNTPCAECDVARFAVDKYSVIVPGAWAVAIHAIDALASGEAPAVVDSLNDDTVDPAPKENAGVLGAAVYRAKKQSYVVASSAQDGASPATMTYGVPGDSPGRHVVFDAPEDPTGASAVSATVQGSRCVVAITAGAGLAGRPLMFDVAAAADGCAVSEETNVGPGMAPPGSDAGVGALDDGGAPEAGMGGGGGGKSGGGCGCRAAGSRASWPFATLAGLALGLAWRRRRAARGSAMAKGEGR